LTHSQGEYVQSSDDSGKATFSGVLNGKYDLKLTNAGYFDESLSDIVINSPSQDLGKIVLTARRRLSGIVRSSLGEPLGGVRLRLMKFDGDRLSRVPWGQIVTTSSAGKFEFESLSPLRYVIFAYRPATVNSPAILPTFYPSGSSPEAAVPADLRGTAVIDNLSISVEQPREGVEVEGTVVGATLPARTPVEVGLFVPGIPSSALASVQTFVGETFRLENVPAGRYALFARATLSNPSRPAPAAPSGGQISGGGLVTRSGVVSIGASNNVSVGMRAETPLVVTEVNVGTRPVKALTLTLADSMPISGKVEIQESVRATPEASSVEFLLLQFQSPKNEALGSYGGVTANGFVNAAGDFRITGTIPGESYFLFRGLRFPKGTYLAAVSQGRRNLLDSSFAIIANKEPVLIALRRDGGTIEGRVDSKGESLSRILVVLVPKQRRIESWYKTTFARTDRTFRITDIAPGQYDLFAFSGIDDQSYYSDGFLRQYSTKGTSITISPNLTLPGLRVELAK